QNLSPKLPRDTSDRKEAISLLKENITFSTLRTAGYEIVSYPSGFAPTEFPGAHVALGSKGNRLSEAFLGVLDLPWLRGPIHLSLREKHAHRIEETLSALSRKDNPNTPEFFFVHLLAPHPPFVFGANGERIAPSAERFHLFDGNHYGDRSRYKAEYLDQLRYLNKLLL